MSSAAPLALAADKDGPAYKVVTAFQPWPQAGMPGPYPGSVVAVHAEKSIDAESEKVDVPTVKEMISRGMRALTGERKAEDAWRRFFTPADVVGIKVNNSGAPGAMSMPEVVAEIVSSLVAVGLKPSQIYIYERFANQMRAAAYERYVPEGVGIVAAEASRGSARNYDPNTYVEVNFFGEEDTRSNMVRSVTEKLTKIINVPNMKDHGAAGVTGCLKNIAYGSFSNVARSHRNEKTNTLTFIGTLAAVEPLRSRTVLNIMDGLRGVWHAGPFSRDRRFRFYPKQMMFGTDPVAVDRLLLDIIDNKRKAEGAMSVWRHSMAYVKPGRGYSDNPNEDRFLREPGHIEYASRLGLGVYDIRKIKVQKIEL
ncbi:MAG: DUF362 domain-containing protein [Acidobacteria bacterium]|nr:DUF362 domain-containing protein [Acidobacteriota bacterium]